MVLGDLFDKLSDIFGERSFFKFDSVIVGLDVLEVVFVVAPADTAIAGRSFSGLGHQLNINMLTI